MKAPVLDESARVIGRVLRDKWRIDGKIARGGVAMVYAATHRNNGHRVAIKMLHAEFCRDADARSRFLQEGYAANKVGHPGVARILDDDVTEEGNAFLVMELLEGELLERRRVRKGGRLPLAEVLSVGDQLLDVLAAAHDKGIVHRDVKPDNLFLLQDGTLKVLDFGFAQMKDGFRTEQTATGFLLGTPGFMSPEQAMGSRGQIDLQTDIWAVGATMFLCLSGRPVHESESVAESLVAAANFQPRSLGSLDAGLPPRIVEAVDRALAFDKADRYPNARMMQRALREAAAGGPVLESATRPVASGAQEPFDAERTISEDNIEIVDLDPEPVSSESRTLLSERPADSDDVPTIATTSPEVQQALIDSVLSGPASSTVVLRGNAADRERDPRPAAGAPAPRPAAGAPAPHPGYAPTPTGPVPSVNVQPGITGPHQAMPEMRSGSSPALSPLAVGGGGLVNTPSQPFASGRGIAPPSPSAPSAPMLPSDVGGARNSGPYAPPPDMGSGRSSLVSHIPTQRQPRIAKNDNRALVLVGIAVLSMAIVLVAGLLVLAASD